MNAPTPSQIRAAAPAASAWVSANAGSGKTRVLTDRVARLLLGGTPPERILCLTYTKAAAAEMQTRLFARLGAWAMMPEPPLRAELARLGEEAAALGPDRLGRARTLFARALETPGGLKIQTIHAFCERLLRRFPLEAGVSPDFQVLEDRAAKALREEVLARLAVEKPEAVAGLARYLSVDDPDPLLAEIGARRASFARAPEPALFGARPEATPDLLLGEVLGADGQAVLDGLLEALADGGPNDQKAGQSLGECLAAVEAEGRLAGIEDCLLYGKDAIKNGPFTAKIGAFPSKDTRARIWPLLPAMEALMGRVEAARARRLGIAAYAKAAALHGFAREWLPAHDAAKAARGVLDFDDLIAGAEALLGRAETAAWVLWRLDGGIDHILVDEAQDTSPAQWRVIEAIASEFFAGAGAREVRRTIFAVGDEKQSIYSFQGADPAQFAASGARFETALGDIGWSLDRCDLLESFRSAPPILQLVDAVFAGPAGAGLGAVEHRAADAARAGRVELWPFMPKPEREEEPPWDRPLDMRGVDDPVLALADRIAAEIAGWLREGRPIPDGEWARPVRAGDILILVQRRSQIFHPVIRALKAHRVPVAGADILRLGGELAVKDLLAALRFAVTPSDDLTLAALLRSPLGGLSERDLFGLAHRRSGTLWRALRESGRFAAARAFLQDLLDQADYLRPYEMLERVLVGHRGRARLVARLGAEAEDGIDALIAEAIGYERVEPPSLTGFLDWMSRGAVTVKRRLDEGSDAVRVMTVHGAKGLEAPVVILPDTGRRQEGRNRPEILDLGGVAAWRLPAEEAPEAMAAAEAERRGRARAENFRLLYVALTRARSWLILCGAGDPGKPDEAWHGIIEAAMGGLGAAPEGERLVLSADWPEAGGQDATEAARPAEALPEWAGRPARAAAEAALPVLPSALGGAATVAGTAPEAEAMARGDRLHRLLEALPGRPAADWPGVAARLLPDAPDRAELLAEAAALVSAPHLAAVFGPEALAEVGIAAPLAALGGRRLLGRIDRLVVEADRVLAVDFKSNRVAPERAEDVPEGILRQMGAYAAALAAVYPGRAVETAVLWTRTGVLMALPPALTQAALARAHLDLGLGAP